MKANAKDPGRPRQAEGVIPITVTPDVVELSKGRVMTIAVHVGGSGKSASGTLDIASSNASVATTPSTLNVRADSTSYFDIVAGNSPGTAVIAVTGDGGKSLTCTVTVS